MSTISVDMRTMDRLALAAVGQQIAQVRPEHLAGPTPCAAWNLGELLRHLVSENHGFAAAAAGLPASWSTVDSDDPYRAYQKSAAAVTAAFAAPDVDDRPVEVREFGVFPGRVAMRMHFLDFLVHGWDVATAIGVPYRPDDESTAAALAIASRLPDTPDVHGPGAPFGARIPMPAGTSDFERLLGLLGRSPAWTPSC
jgi:uncharacterized protein (TIGR03086 family)